MAVMLQDSLDLLEDLVQMGVLVSPDHVVGLGPEVDQGVPEYREDQDYLAHLAGNELVYKSPNIL